MRGILDAFMRAPCRTHTVLRVISVSRARQPREEVMKCGIQSADIRMIHRRSHHPRVAFPLRYHPPHLSPAIYRHTRETPVPSFDKEGPGQPSLVPSDLLPISAPTDRFWALRGRHCRPSARHDPVLPSASDRYPTQHSNALGDAVARGILWTTVGDPGRRGKKQAFCNKPGVGAESDGLILKLRLR